MASNLLNKVFYSSHHYSKIGKYKKACRNLSPSSFFINKIIFFDLINTAQHGNLLDTASFPHSVDQLAVPLLVVL